MKTYITVTVRIRFPLPPGTSDGQHSAKHNKIKEPSNQFMIMQVELRDQVEERSHFSNLKHEELIYYIYLQPKCCTISRDLIRLYIALSRNVTQLETHIAKSDKFFARNKTF